MLKGFNGYTWAYEDTVHLDNIWFRPLLSCKRDSQVRVPPKAPL
jgi:hypothetical protein